MDCYQQPSTVVVLYFPVHCDDVYICCNKKGHFMCSVCCCMYIFYCTKILAAYEIVCHWHVRDIIILPHKWTRIELRSHYNNLLFRIYIIISLTLHNSIIDQNLVNRSHFQLIDTRIYLIKVHH